jgi:hypothetical protein
MSINQSTNLKMPLEFERSFASHEKAKYWSSKNDKKPEEVGKGSSKKYWFDCDSCKHEFEKSLDNIVTKNSWCPYCCNNSSIICLNDNCIKCYNKSFASHEKAQYWSNKNKLTPRQVMKVGDKRCWFKCDKCNHDFEIMIKLVTKNNNWCQYCNSNKLCNNDSCKICYDKSFISHEKSIYWSSKNKISPRNVTKYNNKKYWFDCIVCKHSFESTLSHVSSGKWCPYCCLTADKLYNEDSCTYCYNRSFASHEKAKYWSNINNIIPRNITIGSSKKYWFDCNICNYTFEKHLKSISTHNSWCPKCINKSERKLHNWLLEKYKDVKYLHKYNWCVNPDTGYKLCYDFVVDNKIIIELDGKQHFEQVGNWRSPDEENKRDRYKIKCAIENGLSIIHIYQVDVFHDRNEWSIKLENTIKELINIDSPQLRLINIDDRHFV